jgi:hypothetical protein
MLISPESMEAMIEEVERHPEQLRECWARSYTVSLNHLVTALHDSGLNDSTNHGMPHRSRGSALDPGDRPGDFRCLAPVAAPSGSFY